MNYIFALDALLNAPDLLKKYDTITILKTEAEMLYNLSENNSRDNTRRIKAERTIRILSQVADNIFFSPEKNIENLIKETQAEGIIDNTALITNNVINWSIANNYFLKNIITYSTNNFYTGITYLNFELDELSYNSDLEKFLEEGLIIEEDNCRKGYENEIIVVNKTIVYRIKNKKPECIVNNLNITNSYCTIKPKNIEQLALFNLLKDNNINILLTTGQFGTGKTFCLANYAIEQLEKGNISKIVFVPNNSFNENSREVGTLPGELFDKELIHIGCLLDLMGYDKVKHYIDIEQIEILPVSIARGRSFNNAIIIVNEAQNLTDKHIKLLIGRCGENTRIFFDGDVKQTDNIVFKDRSGIELLTKLKDSSEFSKIFGAIQLKNIERSLTARASAYLETVDY